MTNSFSNNNFLIPIKVSRDHCSFAGKCKGEAYCICNLQQAGPIETAIILNKMNYDFHLMVKHSSENLSLKEFNYLGENTEKYISF